MQFLQKWFKHSKKEKLKESSSLSTEIEPSENWAKIPAYIPADKSDYKKVTLITSVIAAGVYPESQFRVTSIYCKR
ncbi:TPA: hypothetical protein VOO23_000296 [Streptococcus pyogenes]|nr:hypothetical protein [Streptococcus pyogenes]